VGHPFFAIAFVVLSAVGIEDAPASYSQCADGVTLQKDAEARDRVREVAEGPVPTTARIHPRDSLSFSGGKCHCPWQQAEIGPQCAAGDHDPVDVDGVAEQQIDAKLVGELAAAVVFGLKCRPRATRPTAVIVVASDIDDALAAKPLVQPLQAPVSGELCHQRR
jgi:hypothetical protein